MYCFSVPQTVEVSVVLTTTTDTNYCLKFAHVRHRGRNPDGGVFGRTSLHGMLVQKQLSLPQSEAGNLILHGIFHIVWEL
jgi:hypothetical protein